LRKVLASGADYLATGHYARIQYSANGCQLLKAKDEAKDQSYFLYRLGQDELEYLIFPVGDLGKSRVRQLAEPLGLPLSHQRGSQDICFIPDNDYRSFIRQRIPPVAGEVVNREGVVLGRHRGLTGYTVGQRQGLGVSTRARSYVLELDYITNRLVVGSREQLRCSKVIVTELNWVSGAAPRELEGITARVRYRSHEVSVRLTLEGDLSVAVLAEPQLAVTPGQSMVFYRGEEVLGGGIIAGRGEDSR
jgi:tRNA-specific 2-thiouridylase